MAYYSWNTDRDDYFFPLTIPLDAHQSYYKDSEMEHHYPNLYDFRRAAML